MRESSVSVSESNRRVVHGRHSGGPKSVLALFCPLAFAFGAVLLLAVIVLAAQPLADPQVVSATFVAATGCVLLGAVLSRHTGALTLIVTYFFAVFVAIPAAIQIMRDTYPFGGYYSGEQLNAGLLVMAVGLLSFLVGMHLASTRRGHRPTVVKSPEVDASPQALRLTLRMSLLFTAVAAVLGALAGTEGLFTARAEAKDVASEGIQGLLIGRSFALVALALCIVVIRYSRERKLRRSAWLLLIPVVAVCLVVNYPPALPRFQLLGIVLTVMVLLADFFRPLVKSVFTLGATFFLLYFFAPAKDLRNNSLADSFTSIAMAQRDPRTYLLSVDFDGFKQTVDTIVYYSQASPRLGANFLGVVLFWVPRSLWPGKPIHTGQIVSQGLGYWYDNVSNPLPAESFASWGLVGVVVVLLLVGVVVVRIERSVLKAGASSIPQLVLYTVAAGYSTILLRGPLNGVAPMICTAFVLTGVIYVIFRRRQAPP